MFSLRNLVGSFNSGSEGEEKREKREVGGGGGGGGGGGDSKGRVQLENLGKTLKFGSFLGLFYGFL